MKLKIIILIVAIISILLLAIFGSGFKEDVLRKIVDDIPGYNCGNNSLCTSCIIEGDTCSCGQHTCDCGDKTVDKSVCSLYG